MTKPRKLYKKHKHREYCPDPEEGAIYADDLMVTHVTPADVRQAEVHIRTRLNAIKRRNGIPQSKGILFHVLLDGTVKVEPHAKSKYFLYLVKNERMIELLKKIDTKIVGCLKGSAEEAKP